MDLPFAPGGPTYLVTNAAVQIQAGAGQQVRIVNLAAVGTPQYIAWGQTNAVTVTAPIAGTPQLNTLGLLGGTERVFTIPGANLFFIASAATGFLVTLGEGV
jgi:hypothetical protein